MKRVLAPRKKFFAPLAIWPSVDVRAKQAQDDKPLSCRSLSDLYQSTHGLRSQPSLHRHSGMKVSQAQPLLTGLSSALLITARPFGLGCRFDEAPSGDCTLPKSPLAPDDSNQPARVGSSLSHCLEQNKPLFYTQGERHLWAGRH